MSTIFMAFCFQQGREARPFRRLGAAQAFSRRSSNVRLLAQTDVKGAANDDSVGPSEKSESRDACVSQMLSLQLQKSPTPDFEEKCGNSADVSKGISQLGMCKFESSEVSQAVRVSENFFLQ